MTNVIQIENVTKTYDEAKVIDQVTLHVEENKIYGLLGRNGAGKTTLMKLITAQVFPTSGEISVFGEQPYENINVLENICFIKESQQYPDNYRVQDALDVARYLFKYWNEEFAMELVEEFQLPLKQKIKKLSRGMHSTVGIIIGLASRAPLTIFDEPYLGLDAVSRNIFYTKLIEDFGNYPRTIILSTHLIDEVSNILEHVFVIDKGKILIDQDAEELRGMAFNVSGLRGLVDSFIQGKKVIHRESIGGLLTATLMGDSPELPKLAKNYGLEVTPISLQQMIVHLTKSEMKGVVNQ